MDYHCMNRKQLQTLCKQHGVPANLSNREMADRLSSIVKGKEHVSSKKSSKKTKASVKKTSEKVSKVVKKVRFNPKNETFIYEVSGKRLTRRATLISLSKKQTQVVENEISSSPSVGRKRARRDVKDGRVEVKSAVECDDNGNGGLNRRQMRSGGVRIERDLVVSRTRRGSKMARNENEVSEDNAVGGEDAEKISKVGVRITRSRAQSAVDCAESSRILRQTKRSFTKDEDPEILSGNSGQVKGNNRITRSRAKVAGNPSTAESKIEENHQLEEQGLGRFPSRRKSVVVDKGKVESDGIAEKKEIRKRSRNNDVEGSLELEATLEPSKEFERVKNVPTGLSRRTRGNVSTVSTDGELEAHQNVEQNNVCSTEKPLRRSSRNVVDGAEPQKVLHQQNGDVQKDEDSEILGRNCKNFKSINRITRSRSKSAGEASAEESETVMIKSTVSIDRELEAHESVGQADPSLTKDDTKRSNRNASRNHSTVTSSELGGISRDGKLVRAQNRRQEQIQGEDSSMDKGKILAQKQLRRSARHTSKVNLVEPLGSTGEVVGKMHHSRSRMPCIVEEVPSSDNLSAREEPLIIDATLAESESGGITKNLEANCSEQVLESSNKKRKTYNGKYSEKNQLNSVEDSPINSEIEKTEDTAVNIDLEDTEMKNGVGNLTSSKMADGHSPANQSDDSAEPSNIADMREALEAEEQSIGKNKNHGSDNVDDHSNIGDGTLVQEFINLVQLEDGKETSAEPDIQEAFLEEHLNESSGCSSEKNSEIPQDEAEEINAIDTSVGERTSNTENFLAAIQLEELTAGSHLVTVETGSGRTTEIQSISGGANVTEATPCKPTLESEEVNKGDTQNVLQSTMLETSNKNCVGQGEFSAKAIEFSNGIICRGETSVSNASNGICSLAKTAEYVTTNNSEPEEAFHNEKASQVGEKSIAKGYEKNLVLGSSSIPFLADTDGKDAQNKENEVSAGDTQDAVEKENEVLEQEPGSTSEESRGNSTHEISDAKENSQPMAEEKGADVEQSILVASINLQSPGTVDKGSLPNELALPRSNGKHREVSIIGTKSSSCKGKLSMHRDMQEKLKAKLNEDTNDVLNVEVQAESLTHFALEEWQDGREGDTPDVDSISGKLLCQLTGDYDSAKRMELQVSDDRSCGKASPLDESATVNSSELVQENIHDHADLAGERNCTADIVEQCAIIVEENSEGAPKVELGEKSDQKEVASQVNDTASTSMTGIISKEIEVPNEIAVDTMIKPAECIEGDDNLKMDESRAEDNNSDAEVVDSSALSQVISKHLVEEDAMGRHDVSAGSTGISAEGKTKTVAIERIDFLGETENGEASVTDSPVIPGKIFKGEFEENTSAPGFLNEVISANCEDLGKRPNEVAGTVPQDEIKSGELDNFTDENILELGRSASATSDNPIAVNGRAATEKENVGAVVGTLSFKDNSSGAQKEDNVDTIAEVTKFDNDDHFLEAGLGSANENDNLFLNYASPNIRVAATDAGETSMNAEICPQNIEGEAECFETTPTSSEKIKSGRKWGEKNSAEGKFCADTSFIEPEVSSSTAISHPSVTPFLGSDAMTLRDQKDSEGSKDSIHDIEDNARNAIEQVDDCKVALAETGFINGSDCLTTREHSCSNRRESTAKVAEEGVLWEKRCDMAIIADIEKLCAASSLTPRRSADCSAFSPIIFHSNHGITETKSLDFHVDSPQLTSWEMNRIFGSGDQVDVEETTELISEANLMTQDHEDAVEKENLMTNEQVDQQATGKHLGEQEHHTHLSLSDEPIYNHESSEENGLSAINQENVDCEIRKDESYASSERVVLTEVAASSGIRIPQELPEEQVDEREGAATEATFVHSVNDLALNQLSCGSKGKQHAVETVEANGLHCYDDEVVTSTCGSKGKEVYSDNVNVGAILESEMAVDRSTVSPLSASSNSGLEVYVESHISAVREMIALEPSKQDENENSDGGAVETNMVNEAAGGVKEDVMITEQVTPQVNEEQLHEHEIAEEVSKLKSDRDEPTCESDKGSIEQQDALAIIHGTPGDKIQKNESSKFDIANSATVRDTAAEGPWRVELSLLSPPNKSQVAKTGVNTLLAKRLNSSMRKQNNRSTLMQRTPIQLAHDMKENVLSSTKGGKTGNTNITAQKALSNRRALQDLHKK